MGEAMSRRIRGVFNAANFWAIVLYNVLSLNSLEFAKLVGRRLIFKGREQQGFIYIKLNLKAFLSVLVKARTTLTSKATESQGALSSRYHIT